MKPGLQTSEFWLAFTALAGLVSQCLGYGQPAETASGAIAAASLAVVSSWLGAHYISARLQLKTAPENPAKSHYERWLSALNPERSEGQRSKEEAPQQDGELSIE